MIIYKYFFKDLAKLFLLVLLLLLAIMLCYTLARLLNDANIGQLRANVIVTLVSIHLLTTSSILIPTALYIAVFSLLLRKHRDLEMISLLSSGFSEARIMVPVVVFSFLIAILVAVIVLGLNPWAYTIRYDIENQSVTSVQLRHAEADSFIVFKNLTQESDLEEDKTSLVVNVSGVDNEKDELLGVFLFANRGEVEWIWSAKRAELRETSDANKQQPFTLKDGFVYQLSAGKKDVVKYEFDLVSAGVNFSGSPVEHPRTFSMWRLANGTKPRELAEFQWRLLIPFVTFFTGLMAIPISRTPPRRVGNAGRLLLAIGSYTFVFSMIDTSVNLLENQFVDSTLPIWLGWIGFISIVMLLFYKPRLS